MYSGLGYSSYHIGPHFQVTLALCIYYDYAVLLLISPI